MIRFDQFSDSQDVKVNFFANLIDGALFGFGMSFVSLVTVMPVLVKELGGSNVAIGLIPVVWIFGLNFPQVLIANYTGRFPFKKKFVLITALIQRFPWLLLSLACFFFLPAMTAAEAQFLILILLFLAALTGSINLPGWYDLVSKITPVRLRGRLFAMRSILGGVLGMAGGYVVSYVLDAMFFPGNFALLFFLAFTLMMISYIFVAILREKYPNSAREIYKAKDYLKHLLLILKEQKHFRAFLVADAMLMAALMADAFYTVNALKKYDLSEGYAGFFLIIMMISMILGNLFFGNLADRFGHKKNLLVAAVSSTVICLVAVWAPVLEIYYLVFVGAAITTSLNQLSRLAIVVELCREEDRPVYVALTNMITAPFILTGILGGLIADYFGYDPVFLLGAVFASISMYWYWRKVPEPRGAQGS